MTPLRLLVKPVPVGGRVHCQWFGEPPDRPAGALTLPPGPDAAQAALPARFTIDLAPLTAEVGAGLIANAADLAAADDLAAVRDLLGAEGLRALCGALHPFLWRAARDPGAPVLRRAPGARAPADPDWRLVQIWYATVGIATGADQPVYGRCRILVPSSHRPARGATPWWRSLIQLEPDRRPRIRTTLDLPADAFWRHLAATAAPGAHRALLILPDTGLGREDALMRAAQLGYDLKLPGPLLAFAQTATGEVEPAAGPADPAALIGFLGEFDTRWGTRQLDLIVQGRACDIFTAAMERLADADRPAPHLGQVILCAPPGAPRTPVERLAGLPRTWERLTLLASPESSRESNRESNRESRAGSPRPLEHPANLDTIAVTGYPLADLGDEYHAVAEPLILDLRALLTDRRPAAERAIPRADGSRFVIAVR